MRNLIEKILFEEFHTSNIKVRTFDFSEIKHLLFINEGDATAPVYDDDVDYIENRIDRMYGGGDYISMGNHKIEIHPTTHWYQRLNRKMEKEYRDNDKIEDPELSEGMDLIEKSMTSIIYPYLKKINWTANPKPCMELVNNNAIMPNGDRGFYSIILGFSLIGKQKYKIKLITQIKGERLYSKNYNCSKYVINENKKRMKKFHPFYNHLSYDCYAY